jgi:hypothetical protein
MRACALPLLLLATLPLVGCDAPPVEWSEPLEITVPSGGSRLIVDAAGRPGFAPDSIRPVTAPQVPGLCGSTLTTVGGTSHLFATWWSVRPDSSAILYSAASADSGKTWGNPIAVDTADVSSRGCKRPPPSMTTVGDDMHVAYSMTASEGTGVFFAHFMGAMLHSPVAVIYGERLVPTAIAAEGDRIAVAYEEPNGKRQQIDVSVSETQGHIFETHAVATRSVDVATTPAIALNGKMIAVGWTAHRLDASASSRVVRTGRLK